MSLINLNIFKSEEKTRIGIWTVRIIAILTGLMGVINIISALTPALSERLILIRSFSPLELRQGAHIVIVFFGFILILLSHGLWKRKRIAWLATISLLLLSAGLHLIKGFDYEEATVAIALVAWMIVVRSKFHAKTDRPSANKGFIIFLLGWLFTLIYSTIGLMTLTRHFPIDFGLSSALQQSLLLFSIVEQAEIATTTRFGRYFINSVYIIAVLTTLYSLLLILRPVLMRQSASDEDRERAKTIAKTYGATSLIAMTLLDDKSYFFSSGGSYIAYVAKNNVGIALGDPVGSPEDSTNTINEFKTFCEENSWLTAFYQVQPTYLQDYKNSGFKVIEIGEEGNVDLTTFTLQGGKMKSLRSGRNRAERDGLKSEVILPPLSDELLQTLHEISDEWLTNIHGSEKRFSVGWFDEDYMRNNPTMIVINADEVITAFTNILLPYQGGEVTIDLMRYRGGAENGTMDYLFVSLFLWAQEQGYSRFNLGLSALSGVGLESDDPRIEKALHYVYEHIDEFYNFKGLHEFKGKFHPDWQARYLIVPRMTALSTVLIGMMRADSGDDFIWQALKELQKNLHTQ